MLMRSFMVYRRPGLYGGNDELGRGGGAVVAVEAGISRRYSVG